MHFVTKLRPIFWNLHKIMYFFMPIKSYFEKKTSDLVKQYLRKKICSKTRCILYFLKLSKNAFSILVLELKPESIEGWQFFKLKKLKITVIRTTYTIYIVYTLYSIGGSYLPLKKLSMYVLIKYCIQNFII